MERREEREGKDGYHIRQFLLTCLCKFIEMCVTLSRERRQRKREGEGSKGLNRFEKLDDEKDEQSRL